MDLSKKQVLDSLKLIISKKLNDVQDIQREVSEHMERSDKLHKRLDKAIIDLKEDIVAYEKASRDRKM